MEEVQQILVAMGAKEITKAELDSYKLNDVAQTWSKMWQDRKAFGGGPIT